MTPAEPTSAARPDLVVVGGGSAGIAAAIAGAAEGAGVVLVEAHRLGGARLWEGDIPRQALAETANLYDRVRRGAEFGVHLESPRLIWNAVRGRIAAGRNEVKALHREQLATGGVRVVAGTARFTAPNRLVVEPPQRRGGKNTNPLAPIELEAGRIVLATGSARDDRKYPSLESPGCVLPAAAYDFPNLPASLIVIGDDAEACEWAQICGRLGVRTTLLVPGPLLPLFPPDTVAVLARHLANEGVALLTDATVAAIAPTDDGPSLTLAGHPVPLHAEHVLVCAPRVPCWHPLNLAAAGVAAGAAGVFVAAEGATSSPRVWAAGSVAQPRPGNHGPVLHSVATEPALASYGAWTGAGVSLTVPLAHLPHGLAAGAGSGFLRVERHPGGSLVGVHAVGPSALSLVQALAPAVRAGSALSALASDPLWSPGQAEAVAAVRHLAARSRS